MLLLSASRNRLLGGGSAVLLRGVSSKSPGVVPKTKLVVLGTGWGGFRLGKSVTAVEYLLVHHCSSSGSRFSSCVE